MLPHLEELEADVRANSVSEARRLLEDARQPDGRFKALRIRMLEIYVGEGANEAPEKEREVAESLADFLRTAAPGHPSLTGLELQYMPLLHPGLMDAVADAAVACGLESLHLQGPRINHTFLPPLSRVLRSGRLRSLELFHDTSLGSGALDGPRRMYAEFCAALRGSRLETLMLQGSQLWDDSDTGSALLAALTAHPTLRSLLIYDGYFDVAASRATAAEAVAALLEANTPALKSLTISGDLDAEHIEQILGALRGNTQLTELHCEQFYEPHEPRGFNEKFAKRVMLPLVQANATLRKLRWDSDLCGATGKEIDRIMKARRDCSPSVAR